jgi:hypothetical protein
MMLIISIGIIVLRKSRETMQQCLNITLPEAPAIIKELG